MKLRDSSGKGRGAPAPGGAASTAGSGLKQHALAKWKADGRPRGVRAAATNADGLQMRAAATNADRLHTRAAVTLSLIHISEPTRPY